MLLFPLSCFVCNFVLYFEYFLLFFACIFQPNSQQWQMTEKSYAIHFKALNKYTAAYVRFPANNCIICNQITIFHTWRGWCLGDVCGSMESINKWGKLWGYQLFLCVLLGILKGLMDFHNLWISLNILWTINNKMLHAIILWLTQNSPRYICPEIKTIIVASYHKRSCFRFGVKRNTLQVIFIIFHFKFNCSLPFFVYILLSSSKY